MALKRAPQPPAPRPHPCPLPITEPPSVNQLELEWDDSYDACPVQTQEAPVEINPPQLPPAQPPKHIQEMRRTANMFVKGLYIEENEFQDDVMVYDLVAKKDARDDEHRKHKPKRPETDVQTGSVDVPLKNRLSLTLPTSAVAESGQNSLDTKDKGQTDCNSNLQKTTAAELGDDLIAQYEELIRTLDTEARGKPVKADGALKKPVTPVVEEEEDDGMDFTSFSAETPESEKLHSPFGTRFRSASANRSYSQPFTGTFMGHLLTSASLFTKNCIWAAQFKDGSNCSFCRSICKCAVVSSGEHAVQLASCQLAIDGHPGSVGGLPSASPALFPPQHQLSLSANCSLPLPGNKNI